MSIRTRRMKDAATYWPPGQPDGFGGTGYGSPQAVKVRWQNVAELFRDSEAREVVSSAVVYVNQTVAIGGYLYHGTSVASDPKTVDGAREIRQIGESPNLRQTETLVKAWL